VLVDLQQTNRVETLITCVLNLDVLDASGVKVASAVASTTGLKASQTWQFQALFTNPFSVKFQSIAPGPIIAPPGPAASDAQEQAAAAAAKPIIADLRSCAEAAFNSPEGRIIATHAPLNPAELSPSQLSDPAFATEQEVRALAVFYPQLQACQTTAIDEFKQSSVVVVVPILSEDYARSDARIDLLRERKITWGVFNRERKSSTTEMQQRLVGALSGRAP
jgi:hypothetical protein